MGRKRARTRQYLYLCAAGLILTLLAACAPTGIQQKMPESDPLRRGQDLLGQGDFPGAVRANQEVLARFPRTPPGDVALFNLGLISAHYANQERDVEQALQYFKQLKQEFPESPRMEEAGILINLLETLETERRKEPEGAVPRKAAPPEQDPGLQRGQQLLARGDFAGALQANQEVLARSPQSPPGDAALFNLGLIHVHYANPRRDLGQARDCFARLGQEFPDSPRAEEARIWLGILETLEKTRQIDIDIEEKKRELRR